MKREAIEQAESKLRKAQQALDEFEAAKTLEQMESEWDTFLLAIGTFYSKLEQGAKPDGRSAAWFGRKKHERRTDPLLSYLHLARNVSEHGLETPTQRAGSQVTLHPGATAKIATETDGSIRVVEVLSGRVEALLDRVTLVPVQDRRFGYSIDVPSEHLGVTVGNTDPSIIGRLALAYLSSMLEEARAFLDSSRR